MKTNNWLYYYDNISSEIAIEIIDTADLPADKKQELLDSIATDFESVRQFLAKWLEKNEQH